MSLVRTTGTVIVYWIVFIVLALALVLAMASRGPKQRECLDYTLREYREGDAPAKCQAEVYGDQF